MPCCRPKSPKPNFAFFWRFRVDILHLRVTLSRSAPSMHANSTGRPRYHHFGVLGLFWLPRGWGGAAGPPPAPPPPNTPPLSYMPRSAPLQSPPGTAEQGRYSRAQLCTGRGRGAQHCPPHTHPPHTVPPAQPQQLSAGTGEPSFAGFLAPAQWMVE